MAGPRREFSPKGEVPSVVRLMADLGSMLGVLGLNNILAVDCCGLRETSTSLELVIGWPGGGILKFGGVKAELGLLLKTGGG
jgi:hypothetical protein